MDPRAFGGVETDPIMIEDPRAFLYNGWYYNFYWHGGRPPFKNCSSKLCNVALSKTKTPLVPRSWELVTHLPWVRNGCCHMRPKGQKSFCVWGSGPDGCHFPPGWPAPSSNSEPCNGFLPGLGISYTTDIDSGVFVQVPWSVADGVVSPLSNDSMFLRPLGVAHDEVHLEAGAPLQLLSNGDLVHFYAGMTPGFSACGNWTGRYTASWIILDGTDPSKIVGRWNGAKPWLSPSESYETLCHGRPGCIYGGENPETIFLSSATPTGRKDDEFRLFFGAGDGNVGTALVQVTLPSSRRPHHRRPLKHDDQPSLTDPDCGLLGTFIPQTQTCHCDMGWTGANCTLPHLGPASVAAAGSQAYINSTAQSWGGGAIRGPDGTYSLFAAEMTQGCPLHDFNNNSQIIRATAAQPAGPFSRKEVVRVPFAHNPTVRQAPDGTFLLFYIGQPESREINCTARSHSRQLGWKPQTDVVQMAWSRSLKGPWQSRVILPAATPASNQSAWNCHNSNPSPTVLSNGTILLMYRGTPCQLTAPAWREVRQGIAVAADWKSEFVRRPEPLHLVSTSEDAFLWRSDRGFHLITHSWLTCGPPRGAAKPSKLAGSCGAYSFSRDSYTWRTAPVPFYQGDVTFVDGTRTLLQARQRPQILFDATGRPLVLFNGVTAPVQSHSQPVSWTMAVPFVGTPAPAPDIHR